MAASNESESEEGFGELWKAVFETYYNASYNEVLAGKLVNRWQLIDECSKILVAITASGSALSGWALWSQPGYRLIWTSLAGSSAVLGIVHSSLGVAHRLKDWGEIKRAFGGLRVELETLLYRMRFDFDATNREFSRQFIKHRRQYLKADQLVKSDLLLRRGLKVEAQKEVDQSIQEEGKDD